MLDYRLLVSRGSTAPSMPRHWKKLLNRGYEIVRVDIMPDIPGCEGGNVGECAIPPALVYVLRRKGE